MATSPDATQGYSLGGWGKQSLGNERLPRGHQGFRGPRVPGQMDSHILNYKGRFPTVLGSTLTVLNC